MSQQSSPARDRVNLVYREQESKQERELPLKILVIGDYRGHEDERPLDERKPIKVDNRSLGAVMAEHNLQLRFNCPSKLSKDPNDTLGLHLRFASYSDFGPEWIAQQVPELRTLVETRRGLTELKDWLGTTPSLVERFKQSLATPENRMQLRRELGIWSTGSGAGDQVQMLDWIVEGAEIGGRTPAYASLRDAVESYLRTRLGDFDDPIPEPEPKAGPEPEAVDVDAVQASIPEPVRLDELGRSPASAPSLNLGLEAGTGLLEDMLDNLDMAEVVKDKRLQVGKRYKPEQIVVDRAGVDLNIVQLDQVIAAQVDEILHHADFQALEAAWRSLRYLIANVNFRENTEIHLLNCSKDDLIDDFEDAPEIAKSGLYRLVYSREYGTFGGEPFGVMCTTYEFDPGPRDMTLLANCAAVAAMAHVPFIANAAARFFGETSFAGLATYSDIRVIFQTPQYTRWNAFRDTEDSRYVGLCLPRFLLRAPYERHHVHSFTYTERTVTNTSYLWGYASFAFATRVAESFARYRWSPNIVGPTAGGAVTGLPMLPFRSMRRIYDQEPDPRKRRGIEERMPTEIQLTERHEFELSEEGFIGMVFLKGSSQACFFSANSCQRAKVFANTEEGRDASLGARLGVQLPYIFIVCRLAHYLKVLQREEIGRHLERGDLERELNDWLRQYVSDMDNPAAAVRGKRPLRQARVSVTEVPGQAGWYRAHLLLRPHLKYMGASFTLSLVGKLEREGS
jgi:type VI secretion system protein ImpC